jgi:histidinol-phosphate aminotransferase
VYVCLPNNPTGTTNTRAELNDYFARVPEHVLTVVDQAYFEYIEDADYPDAIAEHFAAGRRVLVARTFSKIYGLAGLRVGYGAAPAEIVAAISKVRRAFDLTTQAQEAALASLGDDAELARRRAVNRDGREELERILLKHGFEPAGPAVANFVFADVGGDADRLFDALLREGVIVRPLAGFGAPGAVRVTVGTRDDHAFLDAALERAKAAAGAS